VAAANALAGDLLLAGGGKSNLDVAGVSKKRTRQPDARPNQTTEKIGEGINLMKKELFEELKQSLREAGQIKRGKLKPSRVFEIDPQNDIVKVRGKLGFSQSKFAAILGISTDTLQNWEQGRRSPTGPAKVLLKIATKHPEILLEVA
jgi:putative transcriptional regulator